jgi:nucleoside transporter
MMFLEYAVKGMWFPLASVFLTEAADQGGLGFSAAQKGMIIGTASAVGAVCSPFIAGQLADRFFNTEKFLAVSLLIAGAIKYYTASQTTFWAWIMLSAAYSIMYMPTVALTNSLAMTHLSDSKRQFPAVRVWGTIGWIVVGWGFPMLWLQTNLRLQWLPPFLVGDRLPDVNARMLDSLRAAGILAVFFAAYCWFVLPRTPPSSKNVKSLAFAGAFGLLKHRSFAVLMATTFVISCVHTMYFIHTGAFLKKCGLEARYVMPAMSLGQFSEIVVLALLGRFLTRAGFRAVITLGAACYAARYMLFAIPNPPVWLVVSAMLFHGFCFACFFAAGFIYVDRIAPADIRHSAQTVYTLVMFGLGPAITGWLINPLLVGISTNADNLELTTFPKFWMMTAVASFVAAVAFWILFRDETHDAVVEAA